MKAKQKALTQLIHTGDLDYVEHFQALARVNLEIRGKGATRERLLRKAILEIDVGNFAAGLQSAQDAAAMDETSGEVHYQLAVANVLMAFVRAGALPVGPGMVELPRESALSFLRTALAEFGKAVRLNPEDDEACEDLALLTRFLEEHEGEEKVARALRDTAP